MRTLGEIIDECKNGGEPSVNEMRFAICAMDALLVFDSTALMKLATAEEEKKRPFLVNSAKWQYKESFNRWKKALNKSPKEYLGPNHNPDSPEVQKRRALSQRIVDKLVAKAGT